MKRKENLPRDGGFGLRLGYAVFMTVAFAAMFICAVIFGIFAISDEYLLFLALIFAGVAVFCAFHAALGYLAAYKGGECKRADKLLIAFTALLCPALVGIPAVIGGAYGIRDINDPQGAEERRLHRNGFKLRLASAIIFAVIAAGMIIGSTVTYCLCHSGSFTEWLNESYHGSEYIRNDGTADFISDKRYDYWETIYVSFDNPFEARVGYKNAKGKRDYDYYYFSSADEAAKTMTFRSETGETITLSYSGWENYSRFKELNGWNNEGDEMMFIIMLICTVVAVLIDALLFIGAFAGKKHAWGDVICIVIGAITCPALIGIFALAGGISGYGYLKTRKPKSEPEAQTQEPRETYSGDAAAQGAASAAVVDAEPVPTEYIQPKLPPKARKAIMISMIVSYSLLLLVGILFAAVKGISPMFAKLGVCEEISAQAYGVTIGTMFAALTPTIGYYFATLAPTELSKKNKAVIAAATTAASVVFAVAFYIVIYCAKIDGLTVNNYFEDDDKWFVPLSMAFAVLGLTICYALTLFRINPAKIRTVKPEKTGDGIFDLVKHVTALLVYYIMMFVKAILIFKEKQPEIFILVATALLTWLAFFTAFVFAIICIVLLVGVVIMYFTGVISWAYSPEVGAVQSEPSPTDEYYRRDEYTYVDKYGYTQTVYADRDGKEAYDAGGHYVGSIKKEGNEKKFIPADSRSDSDDEE